MHWRLLDYGGQLLLKLDEHWLNATTTTFTRKRDIRDLTQFLQQVTTTSIATDRELQTSLLTPGRGGGALLWISSDRDDRRIVLGLKFLISKFFRGGKFLQGLLWVFDLSRVFWGYSK